MGRVSSRWFQLSGAAMFAVALAVAANAMLRAWTAADPLHGGELVRGLAVDAALFTVFALHHSVQPRAFVRRHVSRWLDSRAERSLYVWLASLLLITALLAWVRVGHVLWQLTGWLQAGALLLQLAGVGLIAVAARTVGALELAGLRPPLTTQLHVRGPYHRVRHPIYLGFLLVAWCPATMTGDRAWFALLATLYLALAIPIEEQTMQRNLGSAYDDYRARVRWRVIPGIY